MIFVLFSSFLVSAIKSDGKICWSSFVVARKVLGGGVDEMVVKNSLLSFVTLFHITRDGSRLYIFLIDDELIGAHLFRDHPIFF